MLSDWTFLSWSNPDYNPACGKRKKIRHVVKEPNHGGETCEKIYNCETLKECLNGFETLQCPGK